MNVLTIALMQVLCTNEVFLICAVFSNVESGA